MAEEIEIYVRTRFIHNSRGVALLGIFIQNTTRMFIHNSRGVALLIIVSSGSQYLVQDSQGVAPHSILIQDSRGVALHIISIIFIPEVLRDVAH